MIVAKSANSRKRKKLRDRSITTISVKGYKSIAEECTVEIRPLTLLAGANSSGKSSVLQPVLLIKQTLDASYDPGAIFLSGPHVKFTEASQLLSKISGRPRANVFTVKIESGDSISIENTYKKLAKRGFELTKMAFADKSSIAIFKPGLTHDQIMDIVSDEMQETRQMLSKRLEEDLEWAIERVRGFLGLGLVSPDKKRIIPFIFGPSGGIEREIQRIIHIPGLRGNPEREYPTTAIGDNFPGTFENYVASVISYWQDKNDERCDMLGDILKQLGLTWKVSAKHVDDTRVRLHVGRLPHAAKSGARDTVSIADVGFGVSQTLPVVVALLAAEPGQLVFLEQPEIHLHPRAIVALAQILADAAKRGVRVVVETHSRLLLLSIQSLVAEKYIPHDEVKLHWFTRREADGVTEVSSAEMDKDGVYGAWPQDFGDVQLEAEQRYLDIDEKIP